MSEKAMDLDVRIGEYSFKTPFADATAVLRGDKGLLFGNIPQEAAKGLFNDTRNNHKLVFHLAATGPRFSLESEIRIKAIGYHAQEDRFYLVFEFE